MLMSFYICFHTLLTMIIATRCIQDSSDTLPLTLPDQTQNTRMSVCLQFEGILFSDTVFSKSGKVSSGAAIGLLTSDPCPDMQNSELKTNCSLTPCTHIMFWTWICGSVVMVICCTNMHFYNIWTVLVHRYVKDTCSICLPKNIYDNLKLKHCKLIAAFCQHMLSSQEMMSWTLLQSVELNFD